MAGSDIDDAVVVAHAHETASTASHADESPRKKRRLVSFFDDKPGSTGDFGPALDESSYSSDEACSPSSPYSRTRMWNNEAKRRGTPPQQGRGVRFADNEPDFLPTIIVGSHYTPSVTSSPVIRPSHGIFNRGANECPTNGISNDSSDMLLPRWESPGLNISNGDPASWQPQTRPRSIRFAVDGARAGPSISPPRFRPTSERQHDPIQEHQMKAVNFGN
jgi:hypothetical protein